MSSDISRGRRWPHRKTEDEEDIQLGEDAGADDEAAGLAGGARDVTYDKEKPFLRGDAHLCSGFMTRMKDSTMRLIKAFFDRGYGYWAPVNKAWYRLNVDQTSVIAESLAERRSIGDDGYWKATIQEIINSDCNMEETCALSSKQVKAD